VQISSARALFGYKAEKYPFRITLVAADASKDSSVGPHLGWGELATGGVDVYHVPGDHESILKSPGVSAVGDVMRHCMAKAGRAKA
jgi:thioesterase domain-containing protein